MTAETVYRLLVVAPTWVGDTVLAQPLFRRLRERPLPKGFRSLQLAVLAPPESATLLSRMLEVDTVHPNPFQQGQLQLWGRFHVGRHLALYRYHQAIILPNSFKSALIPFIARIPQRTGYRGEQRYGVVNDLRTLDTCALRTMAERFLALADPSGVAPPAIVKPRLQSTRLQQQQTLHALGLMSVPPEPIAVLCPGAEYGPAKRWPVRHFSALAEKFGQHGYQVWVLGSAKDAMIGTEIATHYPKTRNLCGRTTLAQAVDILALADQVVSNDSGLMHIAAALDRPLIALYGASSPNFTPPLSKTAQVIQPTLECSPCFKRTCPLGHFACLEQLSSEQVWQRIQLRLEPRHQRHAERG